MTDFTVESDWSGASYWYQVAALLPGSEIRLPHLDRDSLQGDRVLAGIFESLGVESRFRERIGHFAFPQGDLPDRFEYDFTGCPDLVQTCATTLCAPGYSLPPDRNTDPEGEGD